MRIRASIGILATGALLVLGSARPSSATVIFGTPVGGLGTFIDVNTGNTWLRLDDFYGLSYNDMKAQAETKGFAVADRTTVQNLLNSLPLDQGLWPGYRVVMGGAPNRDLIWGAYLPEGPFLSWAWSFSSDQNWNFVDNTGFSLSGVTNSPGPFQDLDLWAVQTGSAPPPIPEPSTMLLLGSGIMGLIARRRQRA